MSRLFIALRPPPEVRAALLMTRGGVEGARWQDDEQLHLTLRFCGEVSTRAADGLVDALSAIVARAFALRVQGVGHFERKGMPSALWAATAPSADLVALQRRIERASQLAGLNRETRKFVPHLTMARLPREAAGADAWLSRHSDLSAPPWRVASFRLYESVLSPAGARYTTLAEWPLLPAPDEPSRTTDERRRIRLHAQPFGG